MTFFRDEVVSPGDADQDQAEQVRLFQRDLAERGVLWNTYSGVADFERRLRFALSREAVKWHLRFTELCTGDQPVADVTRFPTPRPQPPLGQRPQPTKRDFVLLLKASGEEIEQATIFLNRLTAVTNEYATNMTNRTQELIAADERQEVHDQIFGRAEADADALTSGVERYTPGYSEHFRRSVDLAAKAVTLWAFMEPNLVGEATRLVIAMVDTERALIGNAEALSLLRRSMAQAERSTPTSAASLRWSLGRARRALGRSLQERYSLLSLLVEASTTIEDLLGQER